MLNWVRDKLAEGRLRWQQSVQQQRDNTSPPPLPPPNVIDSSPASPSLTPIANSSRSIDSDDNDSSIQQCRTLAPGQCQNAHHMHNRSSDSIKPNGNIIKQHYSQISTRDQGIVHSGFCQYETWSTNSSLCQSSSTSIVVNRHANNSTVSYVNLRIFNCVGSKCTIYAPLTLTFADVKRKVVAEFHARRQLFLAKSMPSCSNSRNKFEEQKMSCDNLDLVQLSRHYKLTRISKLHENFDECSSLATANVQNNEEMLLILCSNNAATDLRTTAKTKEMPTFSTITKRSSANDNTTANVNSTHHFNYESESDCDDDDGYATTTTTQLEIDMVTAHLEPKNMHGPNVVNIDELVLQSDVQYDIRKILISLANSCAYHIGAGPYATRIINMLKQRLIQRKQHEQDTQQCLIEMGFSRLKVQHALNINNNVYAAALEWLIENQSPINPMHGTDESSAMNLSAKFTNNTSVKDNIESLLEIIRIYYQRDLPPSAEMIQFIVGMGFDEATAYEALKITKNHQSNACEWLVGDRTKINQYEQNDGLPSDSPILAALLTSPHIQLSLSNPKIFMAFLSILEDYGSMNMWMNDSETSNVIGQVLRCYHEEKHIMAINQFSQK